MTSDDRDAIDRLDAYLDAIAAGLPVPVNDVDPEWQAIDRQFGALDRAPTPPPAFAARLLEDLMHAHGMPVVFDPPSRSVQAHYAAPRAEPRTNGHTLSDPRQTDTMTFGGTERSPNLRPLSYQEARSTRRPAMGRARWASVQFATALLLIATLGLGFVTLGLGRPGDERQAVLPALSGETPRETVLEVPLPAEALPHGNRVSASLDLYSLAPGEEASWEPAPGACCPGMRLDYVIEGALAVRPATSARVLRAGASLSPEVIATGMEVVLGPGDVIMTRYEDAFQSASSGTTTTRFLNISFIDGFFPLNADPPGWEYHPSGDVAYGLSVPDGPSTLRLQQVTLDPGSVLEPPPDAITQLGITLAEVMPLRVQNSDAIENINEKPATVHVVTLTSATPAET